MREELNFEVEPAVTLAYENLAFPFLVLLVGLLVASVITSCEKIRTLRIWGGICEKDSNNGAGKRRNWRKHMYPWDG